MRTLGLLSAPRRRRGVPLWVTLAALVLLPMLGVVGLTASVAQSRMDDADSAQRAEQAVRVLALLDAARSAVEREIVPVLSVAVIDDPAVTEFRDMPASVLDGQRDQVARAAREARAVTDAAMADVPRGSVGYAEARAAASSLAAVRNSADAGSMDLESLYLGYLDVSIDLMNAQRRAAAAASSEEVPAATMRAVRDVQTTAELAQAARRQLPLFMGMHFAGSDQAHGSRLAWQAAWLAYTDAQRQMNELAPGSPLRDAWQDARRSPTMRQLDGLLSAQALQDRTVDVGAVHLVGLMLQAAELDALLADLVATAVDGARTLVAADRERAGSRFAGALQLGGSVLLISLVGAVYLGRTVSRSLTQVAGQAREISRGSLVEVEVTGPREVRTVSSALGSAVAGLRRIQDQAQAVARGDLDDPVLEQPLPGRLGEVVHASVREIVNSVRQREELQHALAHQATHDPLTELPNRTQALTLVTAALHRARRSGDMTGLLFVDLDGFKAVNDSHGHATGDDVLRRVAGRLRGVVRPGDVVCRLGGDEFVVLVERVKGERDLVDLAERLIAAVSEPIAVGDHVVRIGASVGVAISRDGGTDADAFFAEADTAAYRAKSHGRGRAEVFDETLRRQLHERAELEAAITHALAHGEMQLHYQPVVDVGNDRIRGYEALLRWNRPGHGLVPPDQFIPVAEGSRLIYDLDRWVLHEATRQLADWRGDGPADPGAEEPTVAVNVSGRHLTDRRIVTDVADALAASGIPAHLLVVEVTETVLVSDPVAIEHLAELRNMGVGIAIDDFGTGYTSIGQLGTMPVDTLKIDRSFIASAEPGARELVALMIRAAHTFGLTVVAEGVEEEAQLERLRDQACDQAQGYLLYRPMPASDAGALLRPTHPGTGAS